MAISLTAYPGLHPVFEALGYAAGYALYKQLRRREGDALTDERRWLLLAAAALGALGGKTIVGGLLGGWLAVELAKLLLRIRTRTGDLYAIPLCIGIAVGRIGCFLAGLADDTYGNPTSLPWAVDFGDGIPRHPTQLYEIAFLLALAAVLRWMSQRPHAQGARFRVFMGAYLVWRLAIDFIKPQPLVAGMDVIQWACGAGLVAIGVGSVTGNAKDLH